jgi:CubicO group peptidase (beta-lactamase class C family)
MTLLPATERALLREIAEAQSTTRLPSITAAVIRDGSLVWTGARGRYADRSGAPPGPGTQYRIGSITKTMTAILVLQCRDDGLLALSDPIGRFVPGVPFGDRTVRQLLAHSSGMNAEPAGDWWERHPGVGFDELTKAMSEEAAAMAPDRQHHYSNLGYGLLGEVVSRLRGAPWIDVVRRRILDPLGMRRTSYLPESPAAQGFSVHPWSGQLDGEPAYDAGAMAPAGQLWSTVEDLARYAAFWLDPTDEVLDPDTVAEMTVPQAADPVEGLTGGYGLGLRLQSEGTSTLVGHTGSMPGFLAGLFVDRVRRIGAVTLANAPYGRCSLLPVDLIRIVAEHEPPMPAEWLPEAPVSPGAELLGPWYWGNTPHLMTVSSGTLVLSLLAGPMRSRFRPAGRDEFVGLDGYFAGERLRVIRDRGGAIRSLELATFVFTRTPYGT